jgi:1,2-phenylacetyl-CoA epoxidase PaaB subunit
MFANTFQYFSDIPDAIQSGLWNYLAYGLQPGSFLESVLTNNYVMAMVRADGTWTRRGLHDLAKWILHEAPIDSWGSAEKYNAWRELTDEQRRDIMIEKKLRPHEFEILSGVEVP